MFIFRPAASAIGINVCAFYSGMKTSRRHFQCRFRATRWRHSFSKDITFECFSHVNTTPVFKDTFHASYRNPYVPRLLCFCSTVAGVTFSNIESHALPGWRMESGRTRDGWISYVDMLSSRSTWALRRQVSCIGFSKSRAFDDCTKTFYWHFSELFGCVWY